MTLDLPFQAFQILLTDADFVRRSLIPFHPHLNQPQIKLLKLVRIHFMFDLRIENALTSEF